MKREKTIALPIRCKFPVCNRAAEVRGLCRTHYHVAWDLEQRGITTMQQLQKAGKIDEPKRNAKEWFLAN